MCRSKQQTRQQIPKDPGLESHSVLKVVVFLTQVVQCLGETISEKHLNVFFKYLWKGNECKRAHSMQEGIFPIAKKKKKKKAIKWTGNFQEVEF